MPELIPFKTTDYLAEARSRVTEQFLDSTTDSGIKLVFDKYLQLIVANQDEIQTYLKAMMQMRDIDTATGDQLDIIGSIVGQERELIAADLYHFFGFDGVTNAEPMGEYGSSLGGIFYTYGDPLGGNRVLSDDVYRVFIKSKIFKNTTASTPEEFIATVNSLFGTTKTYLLEGDDAEFTVYFGRDLTDWEKNLLEYISYQQAYPTRLLPKTVGVKMNFDYTGIPAEAGATGYGYSYGSFYGLGV